MASIPAVAAGQHVLMLERGGWVERSEANRGDEGPFILTPHYTTESRYAVRTKLGWRTQGLCACVGGPSVFYAGASFRFREADFTPPPEIVDGSGAEWPIEYAELEPYYCEAERLLGVAGRSGEDPTEPARTQPFPQAPPPLAVTSTRIREAALALGLRPFRIPMAIDGRTCPSCMTCDAFACSVSAKNDLATSVIPRLVANGLELRSGMVVVRLIEEGGRIRAVVAVDRATGRLETFYANRFVLAAGGLATPHLILASGLRSRNPGGAVIGRYLMRHCNAMTYGLFRSPPNPHNEHHKQIAIQDFYFGDPLRPAFTKLGNIQQTMAPPASLLPWAKLPRAFRPMVDAIVANLTGLLAIAEDQPRAENRVEVTAGQADRFGLPPVRIHHRYSRRDLAARRTLIGRVRQILRAAGAIGTVTWPVSTYSHVVGTVRMGRDPGSSALDRDCRFRGLENLWVTDGSVFPTSAGVNPSLTIAANALRVGTTMVGRG